MCCRDGRWTSPEMIIILSRVCTDEFDRAHMFKVEASLLGLASLAVQRPQTTLKHNNEQSALCRHLCVSICYTKRALGDT